MSGQDYTITSTGTNSQGNHYCTRDYGNKSNAYHYSNKDASYYYKNPDGSKYFNNGKGFAKYTPPSRKSSKSGSSSK